MISIKAGQIYTGKSIAKNSVLQMQGNKITALSTKARGKVDFQCKVITPAFIDGHSHIGMHRAGEPGAEGETNEHMEAIILLADALDSVQMDDVSFQESVEAGVLYSCVVPGSGNIIGGQSAVIRNFGKTTSEALVARAGIKAAMGYNPMSVREWKGKRPYTRMGALALLREKLHAVCLKLENKKKDPLSREEELIRDILEGKERLRIHIHKTDDIESVLRIVDEFAPRYKIRFTVEHACDVHDPLIFRKLAKRKVPVVFGPLDSFAYKVELKHENWRNLKHLLSSGVEFGLMTDHPVILQRMLFHTLRWFLRLGLSKAEAIQIITLKNARILGVDRYLGSLEKGKWASFVCWNGDPFDMTSYPVAVYGEGKLVYGGE